jgi:hypothetical protein
LGRLCFEVDWAVDLSAAKLCAAVYNETDATGMGAAELAWVNLGHAANEQVAAQVLLAARFDHHSIRFTQP